MILRHEDSYSTPVWIGTGLVVLLIGVLSIVGPRATKGRQIMGGEDVSYSYEMARIEPEEGPFDLSGRDVRRRERELEAYQAKKKAGLAGLVGGTGALAKHNKKPNVKPVAIKASAAAVAAARAAKMRVETLAEAERYRRMKSSADAARAGSIPSYPQVYPAPTTPAKSTNATAEKEAEEPKLTAAQWRSLLQLSPSSGNVAKLLAARGAGDIDDGVVLEIAKDLLKDSGDERQKAGLLIVDRLVSPRTFEFMVFEKAEFSQNVQTELQKKIESYGLPARLSFLGPVVASTNEDKSAVIVALGLIETAVTEYKRLASGQITQSASAPSLAQLQVFLTTLRRIGEDGEGAVAEQAKELSSTIAELKPITPKTGITGRPTQTAQIGR